MIEHGKKFQWEYCRDFNPKVVLPDYRELMRSVRTDQALERKKEKEKKEREKRRKLKERAEKEELRKKKRRAMLRKRRERLKKKILKDQLKAQKSKPSTGNASLSADRTRPPKTRRSKLVGKPNDAPFLDAKETLQASFKAHARKGGKGKSSEMPKELKNSEQFQELMPKAVELRVVRGKDSVKLKLRTPEVLYTYKTNEDEADDIIKSVKEIEVIEYGRTKEKSEDNKSDDDGGKKKK